MTKNTYLHVKLEYKINKKCLCIALISNDNEKIITYFN